MDSRFTRHGARLSILATMFLLMVSYQNFSVPGAQLRKFLPEPVKRDYSNASAIEAGVLPAQAPTDIRESAPTRPPAYEQLDGQRYASLQAPAHATSIDGAGTQWAERELRPYLAEYESQFVAGVNHKLNRILKFEEIESEWPSTGDDQSTESNDGGSGRGPASESDGPAFPPPPSPSDFRDLFSLKSYRPTRVQLTKANELTVGFHGETALSCEVASGGSKLKLARPLDNRTQVDVSHDTIDKKNSVHLTISW